MLPCFSHSQQRRYLSGQCTQFSYSNPHIQSSANPLTECETLLWPNNYKGFSSNETWRICTYSKSIVFELPIEIRIRLNYDKVLNRKVNYDAASAWYKYYPSRRYKTIVINDPVEFVPPLGNNSKAENELLGLVMAAFEIVLLWKFVIVLWYCEIRDTVVRLVNNELA